MENRERNKEGGRFFGEEKTGQLGDEIITEMLAYAKKLQALKNDNLNLQKKLTAMKWGNQRLKSIRCKGVEI